MGCLPGGGAMDGKPEGTPEGLGGCMPGNRCFERLPQGKRFLCLCGSGGINSALHCLMLFKQTAFKCWTHVVRGSLVAVVGVFSLAQGVFGADLAWNSNSETNIAGYRLYYGSTSGNYTQSVDVGNVTQATLSNLTAGSKYYAAVTAYSTASLESPKSAEVSFTASGTTSPTNVPPTVSMTSPATGATYAAPANITLTATASDSDGTVSYVEFYSGTTRFVTVTSPPYTFAWNNVAAGNYSVTARAYDDKGAVTISSPVAVTVGGTTVGNNAPTVSLTSPSNGASFVPPATITVTATASDSDGSISKVEFYNGSSLLSTVTTSPYSATFTGVPAGTYILTARAYDNQGLSTTSTVATVTVSSTTTANKAPTVSLTSPTTGASYTAPATISLAATASDSDGTISRVEFYNGSTKLGQSTASPYAFTWSSVAAGTYTITARAYDNSGASTTSAAAKVTVGTSSTVNTPPTVSLTSPVTGSKFTAPATVTLTAAASDADGSISKVVFYNGNTVLATVTRSPYTVTFTGVHAATYTITARAYDNQGASTVSSVANVTVAP